MSSETKNPSKGIFIWGAFLLLLAIWPLFDRPLAPTEGITFDNFSYSRLAATSSIFMKALIIAGGVISFSLCFLWYRLFQIREQRGSIPRILGWAFFIFGTLLLVISFGMPAQEEVMKLKSGHGKDATKSALKTLFVVIFPLILLVSSYFLQFKRSIKSE